MDIKQLKFLVALDETRHFSQAAARCHVTQPTLSMRLRTLEDELGLQLVIRGQRFEGFTPEGERILAWARSLLVGTLRLGVVPLAGFDPMQLVRAFGERHPSLRFELFALSSEQILERLSRNLLDLGLSYLERLDDAHFASLPLGETRMGLAHDERHFRFDAPSLSWKALAGLPLGLLTGGMHFRQSIDHALRSRGLSLAPRLQTDAVHHLLQAVGAGLCCAIMPLDSGLEALDSRLTLTPIDNASTLAPLGLILRRDSPRSALGEACFNEARELLQQR
ncbi:LysR family transcriptional regulator [Stutzerimonas stutzeri]